MEPEAIYCEQEREKEARNVSRTPVEGQQTLTWTNATSAQLQPSDTPEKAKHSKRIARFTFLQDSYFAV